MSVLFTTAFALFTKNQKQWNALNASKVDLHASLGEGAIGWECFAYIMLD